MNFAMVLLLSSMASLRRYFVYRVIPTLYSLCLLYKCPKILSSIERAFMLFSFECSFIKCLRDRFCWKVMLFHHAYSIIWKEMDSFYFFKKMVICISQGKRFFEIFKGNDSVYSSREMILFISSRKRFFVILKGKMILCIPQEKWFFVFLEENESSSLSRKDNLCMFEVLNGKDFFVLVKEKDSLYGKDSSFFSRKKIICNSQEKLSSVFVKENDPLYFSRKNNSL